MQNRQKQKQSKRKTTSAVTTKRNVNVHICHAAPQTGLQRFWVSLKQPHHACPAHAGEDGPSVLLNLLHLLLGQLEEANAAASAVMASDQRIVPRRLHGQLRQRQHHTREHVDANLLIDAARGSLPVSKHPVPAKQSGKEVMHGQLFAAVCVAEGEHGALVEEGEFREVHGVLARRFEDEPELLANRAGAEEEDHDEGVRKADFGSVYGAIADGFEEDKRLFVVWVGDD